MSEAEDAAALKAELAQARTDRKVYYARNILFGDMLWKLPEPEPLIDGMFDMESVSFLYAEPKCYKSFMALDWALCVATGRPWNGRVVSKQNVLYVAAEGVSGIPKRVDAWLKFNKVSREEIADSFFVLKVPVQMPSKLDAETISEMAVAGEIKFVILDTLARCSAGMDENSAKDMGKLVANGDLIKENSGACVLWVHHSGKGKQNDLRGSSALKGAADSVFRMKRNGKDLVKLQNPEQKNRAEQPDMDFTVNMHEDSLVLVCPNKAAVLSENEQRALNSLTTLTLKDGAVPLADWGRQMGVDDVGNAKWLRIARDNLLAKGFVVKDDDGKYVVAS